MKGCLALPAWEHCLAAAEGTTNDGAHTQDVGLQPAVYCTTHSAQHHMLKIRTIPSEAEGMTGALTQISTCLPLP